MVPVIDFLTFLSVVIVVELGSFGVGVRYERFGLVVVEAVEVVAEVVAVLVRGRGGSLHDGARLRVVVRHHKVGC